MQSYHRTNYLNKIKTSLKKEKLVLLYGQRQVGKTTLLNILLKDKELKGLKFLFSFEDVIKRVFNSKQDFLNFLSFELNIDFSKKGYLFLDEVQHIENIVGILKSIYDDKNIKIRIIATGSGMWNIPSKAGSSLVGRGDEIYIYPFSFKEFLGIKGKNINILDINTYSEFTGEMILDLYKEYLIWGGYPEVIKAKTEIGKQNELNKIIKRYFEKDVIFWFKKEEMIDFEKIYFYLYQNTGNLLKIEKISNITGVGVKKIQKYITFLKRSLVIFEIKPFFEDKTKEIFSQGKLYLSDLGIFSFMGKNYGDKLEDRRVVENFVFLELLKNNYNSEIKFYKKKNGTEIDFILENWDSEIIPIEVKSSNSQAIPKIFYLFEDRFSAKTKQYIKTTKTLKIEKYFKKNKEKKVILLPNFLLGKKYFK